MGEVHSKVKKPPQREQANIAAAMRFVYKKMRKEVLAKLTARSKGYKVDKPSLEWFRFGTGKWRKEVGKRVGKPIGRQLALSGSWAMSQVGVARRFDVLDPEIARWLGRYVAHFSRITVRHTSTAFLGKMKEGIEAGESIPELRTRVNTFFDGMERYQADVIARSESSRATHQGMIEGWKQSDVVSGERWDCSPGCCEFCLTLDGKIISLGGSYHEIGAGITGTEGGAMSVGYENVDGPPLHPNCECGISPVLKED